MVTKKQAAGVLLSISALATAGVVAVNESDNAVSQSANVGFTNEGKSVVNNLVKAALEKLDAKDAIAGMYAFSSRHR